MYKTKIENKLQFDTKKSLLTVNSFHFTLFATTIHACASGIE